MQQSSLYLANIDIAVAKFEHQRKGDAGKLYNHPFFGELDVVDCDMCYMQYLSTPVCNGVMNWQKPIKLR